MPKIVQKGRIMKFPGKWDGQPKRGRVIFRRRG